MPKLAPLPLRGIGVTALCDIVRTMLRSGFGDPCGLAKAGVVFPKPALRVEIVLPLLLQPKRDIVFVHWERT